MLASSRKTCFRLGAASARASKEQSNVDGREDFSHRSGSTTSRTHAAASPYLAASSSRPPGPLAAVFDASGTFDNVRRPSGPGLPDCGTSCVVTEPTTADRCAQQLRGVVFDLDDTLTTAEFKGEMWARTIEHIRVALPDVDGDELRRRAGAARAVHYADVLAGTMDVNALWRTQLTEAVAPWGELSEETITRCLREREANLERRRLVVGARELIDRLQAVGLRVGVLTNGPSVLQRRKLAVTGLDRLLDAVAISQEIGAGKPEPGAYRRAAELLGCRPEETAMVGDQLEWDVNGALQAGYRLAVLVGDSPVPLPHGAVQASGLNEVFSCLSHA